MKVDHTTAAAEQNARRNFAEYVQHVAFTLTLSRAMITTLGLVRDFGWPLNTEDGGLHEDFSTVRGVLRLVHTGSADNFIGHYRALERRGLSYFAPSPGWKDLQAMAPAERRKWHGHRHYRLTRAGELTCALLVEAGLMPVAQPQAQAPAKRRAA